MSDTAPLTVNTFRLCIYIREEIKTFHESLLGSEKDYHQTLEQLNSESTTEK